MNRRNQYTPEETTREQQAIAKAGPLDDGVKVDGLQQVVEMLKYADPAFRESLLRRLTQRDPSLASRLKKTLR